MRTMAMTRPMVLLLTAACLLAPMAGGMRAGEPASIVTPALPPGTSFGEDEVDQPRRVFYSERAGGTPSAQTVLGDLLFDAPGLFGGAARNAGMSCGTCHVNGSTNPALFIPGLSS